MSAAKLHADGEAAKVDADGAAAAAGGRLGWTGSLGEHSAERGGDEVEADPEATNRSKGRQRPAGGQA